ncbi:sce7725 family protein [Steroidobacter cummioxidans]|uniref:sce7725 family protein n=1 Tax=Steroidobacter cummioxidans TaxID=1803913 RepID=UPI000E314F05|nr:sce7725 family protein [Steroidobacter cummioxidans]
MYHPYFRGKQYELITVRESAKILKNAGFCPIIEPVRESLGGLEKALDAVVDADGRAIVIVNPHHGDAGSDAVTELLSEQYLSKPQISAGILLKAEMTADEAAKCFEVHVEHAPVAIHAGFSDAKKLLEKLGAPNHNQRHVFFEKHGKIYQRQFKGSQRILLRDGFVKRRNADYEKEEAFSDLHLTYEDEGMTGFGDFLIVGDEYSESGGPAYAIAIHLTFIDPQRDHEMRVYHFKSDRLDTPRDPAGKFAEALEKMIETLDAPSSKVLESSAVREFRSLHDRGHFPGLGYIKKLSMNHHIETLAHFFDPAN